MFAAASGLYCQKSIIVESDILDREIYLALVCLIEITACGVWSNVDYLVSFVCIFSLYFTVVNLC